MPPSKWISCAFREAVGGREIRAMGLIQQAVLPALPQMNGNCARGNLCACIAPVDFYGACAGEFPLGLIYMREELFGFPTSGTVIARAVPDMPVVWCCFLR